MFPEQKWACEYFSPCEFDAKLLCFSVGLFSVSLKHAALVLPRAERLLQICEGDLKEIDGAWWGIHFWADNSQVGLFVQSGMTSTKPE